MNPEIKKCHECGGEMEQGLLISFMPGLPSHWIKGDPEAGWLGKLQLGPVTRYRFRQKYRTKAYRCTQCGYLAIYADEKSWH